MRFLSPLFIFLCFTLPSNTTWAHEGHDHHAHESAPAPHGGLLKTSQGMHLELVSVGDLLKIFPLTAEMKPFPREGSTLAGTFQLPKGKKENILFSPKDDHFEAMIATKGAYRYTLELTFSHKASAKDKLLKANFTFQVEPSI